LFDDQEPTGTSPERGTKGNTKRYNHFEFGDGEEASETGKPTRNVKHQSQWNFEDFVTPDKPRMKVRTQDKRTMSWEDTEEVCKLRADADLHLLIIHSRVRNLQSSVHHNTKPVQMQRPTSSLLTMVPQQQTSPSHVPTRTVWACTRTT
jgi:hypothetical protein